MNEYETIYITDPDLPEVRLSKVKERVEKVIKAQNGEILLCKDWGKRGLAYRVGRFNIGNYIYYNYRCDGAGIAELERTLKFEEGIIRYLTVKLAHDVDTGLESKAKQTELSEEVKFSIEEWA